MAKSLSGEFAQAGCGLMGCGCLLMLLAIIGPIVVIFAMALAAQPLPPGN